jgi:hypothetical protein
MVWPYTLAPASQADKVPIRVTVSNNTSLDAPPFSVKTSVYRTTGTGNNIVVDSNKIYCRTTVVNNLRSNSTLEVDMPVWNARKSQVEQEASYRIVSEIKLANNEKDLIPSNDLTYKDVTLTFSDVFAYDPNADQPINSVQAEGSPANMPGGRGMTLFGSNWGGPGFNLVDDRAGAATGNGSGQIAVKFTLLNTDTLRGYRALFGNLNFAPDFITLSVYDNGGRVPGQEIIAGTQILRRRLIDDITGQISAGTYVTYLLPEPVELAPGTYWLAIAQMGQNGLELGGSASRSGMRVTNRYISPAGVLGEQGNNLILDKNFRRITPQGNYVNDNYFAFENTQLSGNWVEFTPSIGNPAYPHFDHNGLVPVTDQTLTNGTFIPMLRPYFGYRQHGQQSDEFQWCPDDEIPVELISFDGEVRNSGIDLMWETASEDNNSGFIIERKLYNDSQDFEEIAFVSAVGSGTSQVINRYNFTDREVAHGNTYQYRLKQIDLDGTINCAVSQVVTKTFLFDGLVTLEQNSPNPVNSSTTFNFTLEQESDARLEVLDIYGNVIAVVAEGTMSAGPHSVNWNATADNGSEVASGTYIYRLIAGENTLTGKLTVVK